MRKLDLVNRSSVTTRVTNEWFGEPWGPLAGAFVGDRRTVPRKRSLRHVISAEPNTTFLATQGWLEPYAPVSSRTVSAVLHHQFKLLHFGNVKFEGLGCPLLDHFRSPLLRGHRIESQTPRCRDAHRPYRPCLRVVATRRLMDRRVLLVRVRKFRVRKSCPPEEINIADSGSRS